jgi:trafficking protein particle complex subunit 10
VADQLESRLPLRNLHWKSQNRPLRSIESLHVELSKTTSDVTSGGSSDRPASGDMAPAAKERRHQMPGLRATPYLKIYLLRCDDADSYKATYRKTVREWLKIHTPASQSSNKKNSQENHDAYEWLILHVVLPNTNAAKEPLDGVSVNKVESSSNTDAKSSKFLHRSSGTILEKLKADFNVSGKHAPDRVAQIRLSTDDMQKTENPPKQLSRVSSAVQEQMEAWDDVISKLKSLILASFTLRVGQYEEDIRERDSQRSLPGWNFCTFFVLKEGLAQGFESVGLLDDTLAGYEELSTDLENVLANKGNAGPTDTFLPYTEELKRLLMSAKDTSIAETLNWSSVNRPISSSRKPFRELILENRISIFDFKAYILARKMEVLSRMSAVSQGTENLVPLGQMCQLGSSEIPSLSRAVREDIKDV